MRVLYVIDGLGTGGTERSLADMLPRLRRHGVDCSVACLHARSQGAEQEVKDAGIHVQVLSGETPLARARSLVGIVRQHRPDVLHSMIFASNQVSRIAACRVGVPHITSLVGMNYDPVRFSDPRISKWRLRGVQALDALTSRLTSHFHAVTRAVKSAAVRDLWIDPKRVSVIYRGRDRARLGEPGPDRRNEVRRRLELNPYTPVVLTVGRQEFLKGQSILLRAFRRLLDQVPDARLLVAGRDGASTPDLQGLVSELRLRDRVWFLGYRADVPDLLAASDVFAFPSLCEGIGGAIIEAMALGLPIVASRLDSLEEVLTHGADGLLVPPRDPAVLASSLQQLVQDRVLAAALGDRARSTFLERFDLERSVVQTVEMYAGVIEQCR